MPDPPVVHRVLAGPGAGKTRLLTEEIRAQLAQGLAAQAILGITFTRRAADELKGRLRSTVGRKGALPWIGTFHQLARRLQLELDRLPARIDLDRLIPDATALLTSGSRPPWVPGLRFIGVDEAQDLDRTQVGFLRALRAHSPEATLFLVGDPDQAIYGFRDASPRFLLHPETYFAAPVRTIILGQNHRSARQIVATAQAILQDTAHPDSPCHHLTAARPEAHPAVRQILASSPEEEARRIFQEVRTLLAVGVPRAEHAVLVRTRAQFTVLETEASRWGIPLYTPPLEERLDGGRRRKNTDGVTLLTMHQAKGCEWTVVFVAGCQDGLIPHVAARTREEREEERRLLYVAVTRAKQLLWLCRHGAPSPFMISLDRRTAPADHAGAGESVWHRLTGWLRQ